MNDHGPRILLVMLALAACPSESPMGGNDGTETSTGADPDTGATGTADTTAGPDGDCGNGAIDAGEQCDGDELDGVTCPDVNPAYSGGTLTCGASCTFDASACEVPPNTPLVVINELTTEAVLAGEYAGPNDAVELHNAGTAAADLSGWLLSDDPTLAAEKTYAIPDGTMLDPGEFLVLLTLDELTMTGVLPFGLSDENVEVLTLADPGGQTVDYVPFNGYLARVSWCRVPDGGGPWFQCEQTFGSTNQPAENACGNGTADPGEECDGEDVAGSTCADQGFGYTGGVLGCSPTCDFDMDECTTTSDLVINELSSTTDEIEIYNGGDVAVNMGGWILTDDEVDEDYSANLDMDHMLFTVGTVLDPGEYLVIPQGRGPGQHPFGLGENGDTITLFDPTPESDRMPLLIIDQVDYDDGDATVSYCRQPNGPGGTWTVGCTPSMGGAN